MNNKDEIQIESSSSYGGGDITSYEAVVLTHLRHCIEEGSKEMSGGGVKTRIIDGEVVELFYPNQREIFINSVEMLEIAVTPKIEKNKPFKGDIEKLDEHVKQEVENNTEMYHDQISVVKGREKTLKQTFPNKNVDYSSIKNQKYSDLTNKNENLMVKAARYKLSIICKLLDKINFFGEGGASFG